MQINEKKNINQKIEDGIKIENKQEVSTPMFNTGIAFSREMKRSK